MAGLVGDCKLCAMRGDPCSRSKAVLQDELRIPTEQICPAMLANVVTRPKEVEANDKQTISR